MFDASRTTTMLLEGLRKPSDALAWEAFDNRYRPIILGFATRLGLSESDAADVAQETMVQFVQEYRRGRYDRTRGRLRSWLIALAKSKIAQLRRRQARAQAWRGDSALVDLADDHQLTAIWEAQRRHHLLRQALGELRDRSRVHDRTLQAFEMLVVQDVPVAAVARQLQMKPHDVYLAKSRVAQRLRETIASLEACFDEALPAGSG